MKARLPHLVIAASLCASHVFAQGGPASVAVSVVQSKELASGQTYVGTILPSKYSSVAAPRLVLRRAAEITLPPIVV